MNVLLGIGQTVVGLKRSYGLTADARMRANSSVAVVVCGCARVGMAQGVSCHCGRRGFSHASLRSYMKRYHYRVVFPGATMFPSKIILAVSYK